MYSVDTGCVLAPGCNISMFHAIETDEKKFHRTFRGFSGELGLTSSQSKALDRKTRPEGVRPIISF